MSKINIDFNRIAKDQSKRLFAGRANGQEAYKYFNISSFSHESNDRLNLSIPEGVVVSSSYFLGMLEKVLPKFRSPKDFYAITSMDGKDYHEGMLTELDRAVRRGLHKNEPFF
ncbi:hypothetical protein AAF463_23920 (plasmid) [Pantoea sp. BJ2]|uniref:Uncharacterized protein n=1 Tax=Pantoea sp. BJ2 TaxID=3141322 RepID=A0AAU7U499_9GAMM